MVDSRVAGPGTIRRRRECVVCSQRFTTFERIEQTQLFVVKRDGSRQPFDPAKLLAGLTRACVKRPVSRAEIERAAVTIEARLRNDVRDEIASGAIGEAALAVLAGLDRVAYVRFASVYRDFQDADEFTRELERLDAGRSSSRRGIRRTPVR